MLVLLEINPPYNQTSNSLHEALQMYQGGNPINLL